MKYLPSFLLLLLLNICQAEEKEYPGTETLDDALVAKLLAEKLVDTGNVAKVAYEAIEKGLNESDENLARQLIQTAYLERAATFAEGLRSGRVETQREITTFVNIGLEDLKHVVEACKTPVQDDTQLNFEYAPVYWYVKASLLAYTDNGQAYQVALAKAKELNKDNANRMPNLVVMEIQLEENASKRLDQLQDAFKKYPESNGVKKALARMYIQLNKTDEAFKLVSDLVQDDPDNPMYILFLSDYYFNHGDYKSALENLKKLEQLNPKNTEVLAHEALCALFLEDKEQFMDYSKKSLKQEPNNVLLLLLRAEEFIDQKKFENASDELDNAMFFNDKVVSLKVLKAYVEYKLEKSTKEELLKTLDNLTQESKLIVEDARYFAFVYLDLKNSQAFLKFLNETIQRFPNNTGLMQELPQVYLYAGQIDKAKETYEKFLKEKPDNYHLLNNYSWLLSTCPDDTQRDGKKALELGLKAVQVTESKKAFVLSTLAAAYAETGDFDKAIETIQKGLEVCDDPKMKQEMTKELDSYKQKKPFREEIETWKE